MVKKKAKKKVSKKVSKKTSKKTSKKDPQKKSAERKNSKGIGTKLAIYVPKEDEWVIDRMESIQRDRRTAGYRTSLSYELIRLVKERLQEL